MSIGYIVWTKYEKAKENKKMKKIVKLLILICTACTILQISAHAMTRDEALSWAKYHADNRTAIDVDGIYGVQCSDFATAYINYILTGNAYSGRYTTYMGYNYFNISYPEGWQRIENTPDFVPEPGDILCFAAGVYNDAGHVAVAIEGCTVSYMKAIDQDGLSQDPTRYSTLNYFTNYYNFQGVIRPKWDDAVTDTEPPTVNNLKASNISADSFTVNCTLNDNVGVTRVWLNVYGPSGSKGYAVSASNGNFTHTINTSEYGGEGWYSVHLYAFDEAGNETFSGVSEIHAADKEEPPTDVGMICDYENMTVKPGTKIKLEFWYSNATSFDIVIDKDGVEYKRFNNVSSPFYYTPTEEGDYLARGYAKNSAGSTESNRRKFYVRTPKAAVTDCTIEEISGKLLVNTEFENVPARSDIILAAYKKGRFVTAEKRAYSSEKESYIVADDIDEIKIMVWDGISSMKPLCEAKTIKR